MFSIGKIKKKYESILGGGYLRVLNLSRTANTSRGSFKGYQDELPALLAISHADYDDQNEVLKVEGWCLAASSDYRLFLEVEGLGVVCEVKKDTIERNDVYKKNPQYNNQSSGWSSSKSLSIDSKEKVSVVLHFVSREHYKNVRREIEYILDIPIFEVSVDKSIYSSLRNLVKIEGTFDHSGTDIRVEAAWSDDRPVEGQAFEVIQRDDATSVSRFVVNFKSTGVKSGEEINIYFYNGEKFLGNISTKISIASDSAKRKAATTPSVSLQPVEQSGKITLEELLEFQSSAKGMPRGGRTGGVVCYYPPFDTKENLENHYHRASWYLTGKQTSIQNVVFGKEFKDNKVSAAPEFFGVEDADTATFSLMTSGNDYLAQLLRADAVLVWRPIDQALKSFLSQIVGDAEIVTVATEDPSAVEYGNYCRVAWLLLPKQEKERLLNQSQALFRDVLQEERDSGKEIAAVFGTGPSLDQAFEFDFGNCLSVVCNSTVRNPELMDHIRPVFVCAGDAVSHFGVSAYAETFRADLIKVLKERNCYFFTSAAIGYLLIQNHPEVADRVILCEQGLNGLNCELDRMWSLPKFDSTFNIHMLPIASTFSETVYMLGFDGKNPDTSKNEDFWAHSKSAQYHDLVDTGHLAHPTFAINRAQATETRYLASVEESFRSGEAAGKTFFSLADSFTPGLRARPAMEFCFEPSQPGTAKKLRDTKAPTPASLGKRALIVVNINARHFSGGRYHATMIAEAMANHCDEVVVWSNNMPPWSGDLAANPHHNKVRYWVNEFIAAPEGNFDTVILVPDGSRTPKMYHAAFAKAKDVGARTAFVNFESPNWFNAMSPSKKKMADADYWFASSCFSDVILTSAEAGLSYAKSFYQALFHEPAHRVAAPSINSPIADYVNAKALEKEKQVVVISRFGAASSHKNIQAIHELITPEMEGYTLALIAGTAELPSKHELNAFKADLLAKGVELKLLHMVSDREKFEEIAKSRLMVFPSLFEGFGYPPVEAGYMGTPCVAFDLPVLREYAKDHLHFVPKGDMGALRRKISELLLDGGDMGQQLPRTKVDMEFATIAEIGRAHV